MNKQVRLQQKWWTVKKSRAKNTLLCEWIQQLQKGFRKEASEMACVYCNLTDEGSRMLLPPPVSKESTMFIRRFPSCRSGSSLYILNKSLSCIPVWPSAGPRACIGWVSVGEERCRTLSGGPLVKVGVTPLWTLVDVYNTELKLKLLLKVVDGVDCWDRKGFTSPSISMGSGS